MASTRNAFIFALVIHLILGTCAILLISKGFSESIWISILVSALIMVLIDGAFLFHRAMYSLMEDYLRERKKK